MGEENLALTRIRSPYRPAHSKYLYQLSYPSPTLELENLGKYLYKTNCKWEHNVETMVLNRKEEIL
jgi:hypothetical protein